MLASEIGTMPVEIYLVSAIFPDGIRYKTWAVLGRTHHDPLGTARKLAERGHGIHSKGCKHAIQDIRNCNEDEPLYPIECELVAEPMKFEFAGHIREL